VDMHGSVLVCACCCAAVCVFALVCTLVANTICQATSLMIRHDKQQQQQHYMVL
jgi:Na+-translocating ferredoxin:NAD+ oxidoreductase RnfG subunit